jgi:ankyrin repeat protein
MGEPFFGEVCDAYDSPPVDKIVELLLKNGAKPNVSKRDEDGPLHYATMYGQVKAAMLLVQHGADVNAKGAYLRTPLIYAASDGNSPELVQFFNR